MEILSDVWSKFGAYAAWLGISPTEQDAVKAALLVAFTLLILVILGDIYRGEIQNTFHRVKLIGNPTRDDEYRNSLQLPKTMVAPTLDGVFTDVLIYHRIRDFRGRLRTRELKTYRVKLRVRRRFGTATAPGRETDHSYSEDEIETIAKEKPDLTNDGRAGAEIVAMATSRVDYVNELAEIRISKAHNDWSKLQRSTWRRFLRGVRKNNLVEPESVGLVVKFHFPINPYFLLYKHPETNVRSTAWLTVLTSLFAIFMQLVYTQPRQTPQGEPASASSEAGLVLTKQELSADDD